MRQVSKYAIKLAMPLAGFWQIYLLLFSSEFVMGMLSPMLTLTFFDKGSTLFSATISIADRSFWFGLTMMLTQICAVFANIFFSSLSDIIGRKKIILISIFGVTVNSICALLALITGHLFLLIFGMVGFYLVYSSRPVATACIVEKSSSQKKLFFVGLIQFFIGLGYVFGPALSGILADIKIANIPFLVPYILTIIFGSIIFIAFFIFYDNGSIQKSSVNNTYLSKQNFKSIFANKTVLVLIALLILDQLAWGTYFQFIPVIGKQLFALSSADVGFLVSAIGACLVITACLVIPILHKYFSSIWIYYIGVICLSIGITLALFSSSFPNTPFSLNLMWLSTIPTTAGDLIIFSMLTVMFSEATSKTHQGLITGVIYTVAGGITWGISAIIGGILTGIQINASLYLATIAVIGMIVVSFIVGKQQLFSHAKILIKPNIA